MKKLITSCAFLGGCLFYSAGQAQIRSQVPSRPPAQTKLHVQTIKPGSQMDPGAEAPVYNGHLLVQKVPDTYHGHLRIKTPDKKKRHLRIIPPADTSLRKKPDFFRRDQTHPERK